ncbi:bifunctional 4-hydroxy-2-oxoglutarate aldolase/2-dehydro-3-deoxy-phosphogluconate aldolase [Gracilibacillus sp. D59]|uniref:bifunctional 4-hydroxy-2-oxoglutarate aldolase/2-dehydro-3-deoxy-phosphogluconate aldolase n=1 Tax=Gracilibacillus sp. D59 TaxID=3457434 RepID=UPI003FCD08FB
MEMIKQLKNSGVVIIYRGYTAEKCLELSEILMQAGLRFFEVTMNSEHALESIRLLRNTLPEEVHIGAGTVTTVEQVKLAAEAGASYIISPNTNMDVIHKTKELQLVSIPGAFTPTEIESAWENGADMVKVFPINVVGHEYITQIRGPLDHIPLMPSGGITLDMAESLFKVGASAIGVGIHLLGKNYVDTINRDGLQASARKLIRASSSS